VSRYCDITVSFNMYISASCFSAFGRQVSFCVNVRLRNQFDIVQIHILRTDETSQIVDSQINRE
jgi:hypothetical protein